MSWQLDQTRGLLVHQQSRGLFLEREELQGGSVLSLLSSVEESRTATIARRLRQRVEPPVDESPHPQVERLTWGRDS
jgi:hypothetical protein